MSLNVSRMLLLNVLTSQEAVYSRSFHSQMFALVLSKERKIGGCNYRTSFSSSPHLLPPALHRDLKFRQTSTVHQVWICADDVAHEYEKPNEYGELTYSAITTLAGGDGRQR